MMGAKPKEKMKEVVDDMVDTVAGTEPKVVSSYLLKNKIIISYD